MSLAPPCCYSRLIVISSAFHLNEPFWYHLNDFSATNAKQPLCGSESMFLQSDCRGKRK